MSETLLGTGQCPQYVAANQPCPVPADVYQESDGTYRSQCGSGHVQFFDSRYFATLTITPAVT